MTLSKMDLVTELILFREENGFENDVMWKHYAPILLKYLALGSDREFLTAMQDAVEAHCLRYDVRTAPKRLADLDDTLWKMEDEMPPTGPTARRKRMGRL